ncbi:MAG TPA: 4-alpha-glucanotransferase [Gemmataceae bacterium]|nr:4-alpha-glucanotransferase [Gemmataceae bacterium]
MTDLAHKSQRSAGVLLHPTSLPSPFGMGDLGPSAFAWVDALGRARQKWWQILPLGPTGYGDSPYQSFSAFAGNPYLISPELLVRDGLLQQADLAGTEAFPVVTIDYGKAIKFKVGMLKHAWERFQKGAAAHLRPAFDRFQIQEAGWLDDYAAFMAIKVAHGGRSWLEWPADLVLRKPEAIKQARLDLKNDIELIKFGQFLFFRQWCDVKQHAAAKGIRLIGDIPIFVSSDSADVWSNPELFQLDQHRRPTVVAGVPPDYFSATGQLWGNPLYDWAKLEETNFRWWVERLRATLNLVDLIRLDHFRGFEAYWEIPAGKPTAESGRWVKAPGDKLITTLRNELGHLPLLAEDLGVITPEVEVLREQFGLPGMRILQFAFGGAPEDRFLPHNYEQNTVVYTGTHDNDTTHGWYAGLSEKERGFLHRYLFEGDRDIAWDMIRLAWSSVANYALTPLQDILSLGSQARMNFPGRAAGNWCWRYTPEMLAPNLLDRLGELTTIYSR